VTRARLPEDRRPDALAATTEAGCPMPLGHGAHCFSLSQGVSEDAVYHLLATHFTTTTHAHGTRAWTHARARLHGMRERTDTCDAYVAIVDRSPTHVSVACAILGACSPTDSDPVHAAPWMNVMH